MRLTCPFCGPRDRREFTYYGAADWLARPAAEAPPEVWHDYIHLRDNPAGETEDLWYHELGCTQWLRVRRDTVTHAVLAVAPVLAAPAPPPPPPPPAPPSASGGEVSAAEVSAGEVSVRAKGRGRRRGGGDAA